MTNAPYAPNTVIKEAIKFLPIPMQTWQLVSQDICTHEKEDYLITVCHFSNWIVVSELQDTLAATVISKTKAHFAFFGISQTCHTDSGPQFACLTFLPPKVDSNTQPLHHTAPKEMAEPKLLSKYPNQC